MDAIADFEDLLELFARHKVRYLIVGGLAFIYHAKPRYTKDIDLWVEMSVENMRKANRALAEFGSPTLLDFNTPNQIVQIGLAPNRIDILVDMGTLSFEHAWSKRIAGHYGNSPANWIDLDSLLEIKNAIDHPRHQEDARILKEVKKLRERDKNRPVS